MAVDVKGKNAEKVKEYNKNKKNWSEKLSVITLGEE